MAEQWYPGAIRVNGAAAGFSRGFNRMEAVKLHYTVGVNSYGVGVRGYFQFLINRDGTIYQFAEVAAICWDSGEWNDAGPGVEVEYHPDYHDEIFNSAMREAARGLVHWLHEEHGFPLDQWPGDRISEWAGFRGFIDHADLIQTEQHYDYWPRGDWLFIANEAPTPNKADRMNPSLFQSPSDPTGAVYVYDPNNHTKTHVQGPEALSAIQSLWAYVGIANNIVNNDVAGAILADARDLRAVPSAPTPAPVDVKALAAEIVRQLPPDVDADPRAIAEAVRDEFATRPLQ